MLWYKGWLETRFRLLIALGLFGPLFAGIASLQPQVQVRAIAFSVTYGVVFISIMLSGAGIATTRSLQATKGLHGSTLFTLSLPVSRFRLLAVRATLGWLEMTGAIGAMCCGLWILFPVLRATVTPEEMLKYTITLVVCTSGLYSIAVLLATFLDNPGRTWGCMLGFGALWWPANHIPASVNIFRVMDEGSPLITHTMPSTEMAVSLGLAAILFFAALKVVQTREY